MVRNLYRFYLYIVYIALLIFAAGVTGQLLNTVLQQTPLRGADGSVPSQAQIVQSLVFAVVAWVIAGAVGGLHYWLIRRDIQSDPAAGTGAIRSFFLNITEALGIAFAVPFIGFSVFGSLGSYAGANVVGPLAFALPALGMVVLLELERRRSEVSAGAALAFQRLHFYGVQILLLTCLTYAWHSAIRPLVDGLIFSGHGTLEACRSNGDGNYCPSYNLFYLAISVLWFVAFWIGYGRLVRHDNSCLLRLILHGASFAYGVGFVLAGIFIAVQLIILPLFKLTASLKDILGLYSQYDFISPLTLGILVVGTYHLWLSIAAKQGLIDRAVLFLMECAIAEILSASVFWSGCGYLLYNFFQMLTPVPNAPDANAWVSAIASVVAGLGYIPLDLYLRRRNTVDSSTGSGPRRGVVLALLGGGILALAIGCATALYAWMTALFGSAITNWQQVAHSGLAAFIVGVFLVGIYLWSAIGEHLLSGRGKQSVTAVTPSAPSAAVVESPAEPTTIEDVLDELLAGKITRDEAAVRIRALSSTPVSTGNQV
jgi:hypothetical protein